jgi:hypothetical protein
VCALWTAEPSCGQRSSSFPSFRRVGLLIHPVPHASKASKKANIAAAPSEEAQRENRSHRDDVAHPAAAISAAASRLHLWP